ncbi:MAG: GAF domain-containing sensor histidine kinase [Patescibacteria group bacterium]
MTVLELTRGHILEGVIGIIRQTAWPDLKAMSLRYYDPFESCLRAESDWGCWLHYRRPAKVSLTGTLSGCAFKENDLRFVQRIQESHFYPAKDSEKAQKQGFVSTIALPLRWQGRVIGTAQLYFGQEVELNQSMLETAWQIADLCSSEVYAWLCSEAQRKTIEAMSYTNPNRALDTFLKQTILLFGIGRAVIYLKKSADTVELVRGFPFKEAHGLGKTFSLAEELPFLSVVERNNKEEFFGREDKQLWFIQPLLARNKMKGILVVPIPVLGEAKAFLVLDLPEDYPAISIEDQEVIQALVGHASLLLTHYFSDEEKRRAGVIRLVSAIEHEVTHCLINAIVEAGSLSPAAKHIKKAERILREMLALYAGKGLEFEPLAIDRILFKVAEEAQKLDIAKEKEVKVVTDGYLSVNRPLIIGNKSLIKRALMNLIRNGLEAIKQGESVFIELSADAKWAYINVTTPTVIEGIDLERIFDPEFSTKTGLGHGTGLHLVDLIADTHGGHASVKPNGGETTFILQLPFEKSLEIKE